MKKAAVIGLGDISSTHLDAISNNPEIELAAVCDIDESRKEAAPKGVPFYTDYHEMFEEIHPDVAHICLPHYLHVPVSMDAVLKGINVFCEKPVALNSEQGKQFVEFEEAHPECHIGICLQNRFNPTTVMLKDIIDSGEYGKLTGIRGLVPWERSASYYEDKPWRGRWETAGGGCMINQSVHTLDLLYYLGGPIDHLHASVSQILDYGIEVEDTVSASLHFANGARGLFMATNANYKNESVQISVSLENGEFIIDDAVLYQIDKDGNRKVLAEDDRRYGVKFYYGSSHSKIIARFYRALEEDSQNYLHVRDAYMSICLIDAIQESGRLGKTVEIST